MSRANPGVSLPTEVALIAAMNTITGSGFARLKGAIAALAPEFAVDLFEPGPEVTELEARANRDELPLVCIDNAKLGGAGPGPVAHCVVIKSYDTATTEWLVLDPWPGIADEHRIPHNRFRDVWCEGYAVIKNT
jgi:hypothetical protein